MSSFVRVQVLQYKSKMCNKQDHGIKHHTLYCYSTDYTIIHTNMCHYLYHNSNSLPMSCFVKEHHHHPPLVSCMLLIFPGISANEICKV